MYVQNQHIATSEIYLYVIYYDKLSAIFSEHVLMVRQALKWRNSI